MGYKNRIGSFLIFWGLILLFVFFASLYTPDRNYTYLAFFAGIALCFYGFQLQRAKTAPPPPPAPAGEAPPPAAPPAPAKPPAPKPQGLLTTLFKGPPPKITAPPPPMAAAPPPPPPKKGLAGLFAPKPKK